MAAPWRGGGPNDGWNDPPMFSYDNTPKAQGHSPSRTLLNKRVAYPLSQGNNGASGQGVNTGPSGGAGTLLSPSSGPPKLSPIQILPPTSSTSVNPPVPLLVPSKSPPVDASALPPSFASAAKDPYKSETLPELLERLQLDSADLLRKYTKRILHETVDKLKDSIQGRSREDVQQRLGILDDQWRDDKISEGAKVKLGCLASAIQNDDLKCADALHLSLMVDHISEVSQWMVGVKRLINELKLLKPPTTPSNTSDEKQGFFNVVTNSSSENNASNVSNPESSMQSPIPNPTHHEEHDNLKSDSQCGDDANAKPIADTQEQSGDNNNVDNGSIGNTSDQTEPETNDPQEAAAEIS